MREYLGKQCYIFRNLPKTPVPLRIIIAKTAGPELLLLSLEDVHIIDQAPSA